MDAAPHLPVNTSAPRGTARLFLAAGTSFAAHLRAYGALPPTLPGATRAGAGAPANAETVIEQVRAAGLDGRGGAGFPVWRKLASTRSHASGRGSRPAVVIANGSEGEPLSRKDHALLSLAPHLVIDGLLLCAAAVGASDLHFFTTAELAPGVLRALGERPDARHVKVLVTPEAFVAGEATAVVNAVERAVSVPRDHVLHLSEAGLKGRPTLVQNVETLAQLALIARFGAEWFRSIGTEQEPGTRLVTVCGDVATPQVLEVAGGTPLSVLIAAAGGASAPVSAVLVGGYHGAWVPAPALDTPLSREALSPFGAAPSAGVVFVLSSARCGLETAAGIATYLAEQSAGQCGPCVNGLPAMAGVLSRIASRARDPRLPAEVARLADFVTGRGSCSHPDGTARFVLSSLSVFASDVRAHLASSCEVHGA
ncbi:NADH-ubiquinone oxidoreductase-F iron-sulfur binding region domain-containing protein [Subtercola sp. RTI3]|uniref:NADH-ubiquinone oxidoreductase-F iron-sulfur binding region domain-containing protein n=1 Tax=Subtercola sp. RTI3 TaxID=3048639 RepID=UPI002B22F60C|nr:NADH-ubiquinone oxidoreductase-F iron-sulfur binding region domain-containing protein [Subtercola sp. RTI3]MEA9984986.1 NADH-ubiquinone oxidoreductase-F iron-sulfur binding region domain-containing protein [Subtercola sp. RTI3]